jgi:hypothetical protein
MLWLLNFLVKADEMRRTIPYCMSVVIGILLALIAQTTAIAADITLIVPTQYSTIQSAIDAAALLVADPANAGNSYSVLVEPGTYAGGITLTTGVPVRGREAAGTIITISGTGAAVTANNITGVSFRNFTIINAAVGISVSGNATVSITNNVFQNAITAVQVLGSPSTELINNTFYQNGTAVIRDSDTIRIINNVFSNNTSNINQGTLASQLNISYNCFNPGPVSGEPTGTNFIPNTAIPNPDPLFVDPVHFDFHVQQETAAHIPSSSIDTGDPTITDRIDATRSDIGAYGGPYADTIPFPVSGLVSAPTSSTSISVNWSPNNSYLVTNTVKPGGYNIYYSLNTPGAPYQTKSSVASTITSTIISGLTATAAMPSAVPSIIQTSPRDRQLELTWTASSGATGYNVHYGIASVSENTIDVGNTTTYTLPGLTNGQMYQMAVSAYAQPTYFISVTAFDSTGQSQTPGVQHESAYSTEIATLLGARAETANSSIVTDFPEPVVPYPNLPNEGCFIATAAYEYYTAPEVQALRDFRDRYLLTSAPGRAFVRWYYTYGPHGARFINLHPELKPIVRIALMPAVGGAMFLTQTSLLTRCLIIIGIGLSLLFILHRKKVFPFGGTR